MEKNAVILKRHRQMHSMPAFSA